MEEIWKSIKGYEGLYEVSNMGRVKALAKTVTYKVKGVDVSKSFPETIKVAKQEQNGYLRLNLCKDGIKKFFSIHRLVAEAFIPNPDNLPQVNHKDENKLNNCVDNLEWCTEQYNSAYGTRAERIYNNGGGSRHKKVGKYDIAGNLLGTWDSIKQAAEANGVSRAAISLCVNDKPSAGKVFGYIYRYVS